MLVLRELKFPSSHSQSWLSPLIILVMSLQEKCRQFYRKLRYLSFFSVYPSIISFLPLSLRIFSFFDDVSVCFCPFIFFITLLEASDKWETQTGGFSDLMLYTDIFLRDSRSRAVRDRTPSPRGYVRWADLPGASKFRDRSRAKERLLPDDPSSGKCIPPSANASARGSASCSSRRPLLLQLRVMLAVPTLGECGCGRTLGGIRVLVRLLVVPPPYHREVGHLEGVGLLAAALQRACHTIAHVEVARWDIRCQVQL